MAHAAGIQNYWPLTYRELFIRWQVTVKKEAEFQSSICATILNASIAICHSQPFRKGSRSPTFVTSESLLPWNQKPTTEVIRLEKEDFGALQQLLF